MKGSLTPKWNSDNNRARASHAVARKKSARAVTGLFDKKACRIKSRIKKKQIQDNRKPKDETTWWGTVRDDVVGNKKELERYSRYLEQRYTAYLQDRSRANDKPRSRTTARNSGKPIKERLRKKPGIPCRSHDYSIKRSFGGRDSRVQDIVFVGDEEKDGPRVASVIADDEGSLLARILSSFARLFCCAGQVYGKSMDDTDDEAVNVALVVPSKQQPRLSNSRKAFSGLACVNEGLSNKKEEHARQEQSRLGSNALNRRCRSELVGTGSAKNPFFLSQLGDGNSRIEIERTSSLPTHCHQQENAAAAVANPDDLPLVDLLTSVKDYTQDEGSAANDEDDSNPCTKYYDRLVCGSMSDSLDSLSYESSTDLNGVVTKSRSFPASLKQRIFRGRSKEEPLYLI